MLQHFMIIVKLCETVYTFVDIVKLCEAVFLLYTV